MSIRMPFAAGVAAALLAGCQSGPPFIDAAQPEAVNMAVRRAQFQMNCPGATGQVISRETLQPVVQTFRDSGPERAEYAAGVIGCGQRATFIVICPDNGSGACYAGGARSGMP